MLHRLNVIDDFSQAGEGCSVPSSIMLMKMLIQPSLEFSVFNFSEGNLVAVSENIIDGIDYKVEDGIFIIQYDESMYGELDVKINDNGYLEVTV